MTRNTLYKNDYLFQSEEGELMTVNLTNHGHSPDSSSFEKELYSKLTQRLGNELPEDVERERLNQLIQETIPTLKSADWLGGDAKNLKLITNVNVLNETKY